MSNLLDFIPHKTYTLIMHIIQKRLLDLISKNNIAHLSLREIGNLINEKHPQKIKHHLNRLKDKGLIIENALTREIKTTSKGALSENDLLIIPILGGVNCGTASIFAEENIEGYIRISKKIINNKKKLFALKAHGASMNKAKIKNNNITDGDYVIIDPSDKSVENGEYVLSIIDGVCNVKKIFIDKKNKQIILLSESTENNSPIYIKPRETNYFIGGKVINVMKKAKM